mmetsp:Transcript_134935/g.233892  ORF Transcript_134935/g.233892 Transcript_134935/m.233892 type:complete len:275 (-) Transcript_134935:57-881(-)
MWRASLSDTTTRTMSRSCRIGQSLPVHPSHCAGSCGTISSTSTASATIASRWALQYGAASHSDGTSRRARPYPSIRRSTSGAPAPRASPSGPLSFAGCRPKRSSWRCTRPTTHRSEGTRTCMFCSGAWEARGTRPPSRSSTPTPCTSSSTPTSTARLSTWQRGATVRPISRMSGGTSTTATPTIGTPSAGTTGSTRSVAWKRRSTCWAATRRRWWTPCGRCGALQPACCTCPAPTRMGSSSQTGRTPSWMGSIRRSGGPAPGFWSSGWPRGTAP